MTGIIVSTPPSVELPPGSNASNPTVLPPVTYTYALLNIPQTWTALQTFPAGNLSAVKADVGLGNVDNTSDVDKPVSTAQVTALALKANTASPTLTGAPAAPTATVGTNTTQIATTAFVLANSIKDGSELSWLPSNGAGLWYDTATTPNRFFVGTDVALDNWRVFPAGLGASAFTIDGASGAAVFTAPLTAQDPLAAGTTVAQTSSLAKFFGGSPTNPKTANTPTVSISRYEAQNSAVFTGGSGALYVEVVANGAGSGNPNTAAINAQASQTGVGDVVAVVGQATGGGAGGASHDCYGGFFSSFATTPNSSAFAIQTGVNAFVNNTWSPNTFIPVGSAVGFDNASQGTKRALAAYTVRNGGDLFDVGIGIMQQSVLTAAIQDDSSSINVLVATGTHGNGINFNSTTFTGVPFISTGFSVNNSGIITGAGIGIGAAYATLGTGINQISGSNTGQFVVAVQNSHGAVGDKGMLIAAGSSTATDASTPMLQFYTSALGAVVGVISRNGTNTVSYGTSSDVRLKENFKPTTRGLADLNRIDVEDFNWKSDPSTGRVQGFAAQKLYGIYPEAVHVGGDDPQKDAWQVDYGRLTPLLIKSVQQMDARIMALEAKLEGATEELARVRARVNDG